MTKARFFAAIAVLGLMVSVTAESADAGRFRIFRRATPQRTIQQPRSVWTQRARVVRPTTIQRTTSPSRTSGNPWPGAIGAPSHRYEFFQDSFGYWN